MRFLRTPSGVACPSALRIAGDGVRYVASFGHGPGTINGTGVPSRLELPSFPRANFWPLLLGPGVRCDQPDGPPGIGGCR